MKPSVLINLDRPRQIRLDTNALVTVEEVLGKPSSELQAGFGYRELRALLWAGLRHEDRKLTLDQTGDLMDLADYEYISGQVGKAITLSLGKPGEVEVEDPNG